MNTNNINPDLLTAHYLLNIENKEYSKYVDTAGYHVQQAIEKSIKYFLHNIHGIDNTTRSFKTHNLMNLFIRLEEIDPAFAERYADLRAMCEAITSWEALSRYEESRCSTRTEVRAALGIATRLYEDVRMADAERYADSNEETNDVPWTELWSEGRSAEAGNHSSDDDSQLSMQDDDDFGPRP
ncbi:MAG: HEPN domain-containing protein [Desulfovibrio sp.]|nr:HEPN domain-containing protein [Desulfovibrio sp.]